MTVTADAAGNRHRITVTLIPRAAGDLARLHRRTGLSKTDIVNRAVTLYEFIDAAAGDGAEILVRLAGGDVHHLKLL